MTTCIDSIDEIGRNVRIGSAREDLLDRTMELERSALSAFVFDYVANGDVPVECPDGYGNDWLHREHAAILAAHRMDAQTTAP